MSLKVFLDTDIGDDIDDAYALALILASPELDLVGVSTVFGNTPARAQQALTVLEVAGRREIPVAIGSPGILSPRTQFDFSPVARYLDNHQPLQQNSCLPWEQLAAPQKADGPEFLIQKIMEGQDDIIPITIGAMTNMALALIQEPKIRAKIPRIVSMAGVFSQHFSEWNICGDPVAAAIVFNSGVPMTVVGLDVTMQCVFNDEHLARLNGSERPLAKNLAEATRGWGGRYPVLHDPLAVETLIRPDIVETRNGTVTVELSGEKTYGFTLFTPSKEGEKGPHDVCFGVKGLEAVELWLDRVLAL